MNERWSSPVERAYLIADRKRRRCSERIWDEMSLLYALESGLGEAAEIAKAALFLASDESHFMTGAELLVDDGITAACGTPK
jgi:NAD(P)-dependent dehydrogenase (short-subunit alcohol dehydrogenase family)